MKISDCSFNIGCFRIWSLSYISVVETNKDQISDKSFSRAQKLSIETSHLYTNCLIIRKIELRNLWNFV